MLVDLMEWSMDKIQEIEMVETKDKTLPGERAGGVDEEEEEEEEEQE